jgi:outer membrane protein assembly factor BamB
MELGGQQRLVVAVALAAVAFVLVAIGTGAGVLDSGRSGSEGDSGRSQSANGAQSGSIDWPFFGRVPERTHYLPDEGRALTPPLREAWSVNTHALIEFPPAIANGVAYVINKFGNGKAVRLSDRKVLWEVNVHPSNHGKPTDVTAPVYHQGRVYGAFLDGDVAAGDAETGKRVWVRKLSGHLESSPLAIGETLYLGTDKTDVVALRTSDGSTRWRFNSPGAIKASPSFHDGRVFVADYEGSMFALEAESGKPVWRTNTTKVQPFGQGGFFSSPAIGFGNVYAARDDGTVFAFDEKTGKVAWSFDAGGQVYGSPAIAQVPGTPASVYIGSEGGRFFALDARTGKRRWTYKVGGPVPGTAVVVGHTVYTSSFKTDKTIGLDTRSGKRTFQTGQAGYTPVISDGRRLYLIGYFELIGLEPTKR